ncbi:MAG TPA: iron-containing alcohol dehydrogenase [Deltaproteobacteria bacterium]|nr:iron-containing alcohol dehydrogenase [Deltaproteobacteria bacterium]HPP80635.1 iron-containing alcohol dehydrogenase [Deltaproteobacteria bacterium]
MRFETVRFEFVLPGRIVFGNGCSGDLPSLAKEMGSRCILVTGSSPERLHGLVEELGSSGILGRVFRVEREPTTDDVRRGVLEARQAECDLVVSIGGGSAIDTGKAVSAMLTNPGDLEDYLEVVGKARPLANPCAPLIAVPPTAGTGSEATKNAVLISKEHGVKVSLRSIMLLPALVLVDPALTLSLPPRLTACTGLDALTQLLEAFVSRASNPMTDCLCREGLSRAAGSLLAAYRTGDAIEPRADMSLASLLSGMALANAGLGAVHGLAAAIGGLYRAPHGFVCASLLAGVVEANILSLCRPGEPSRAIDKYTEASRILTGDSQEDPADLVRWIKRLCRELEAPSLSELGVDKAGFEPIVARALRSSSMRGNPVVLSEDELMDILAGAL